jgi:hypothetical protein
MKGTTSLVISATLMLATLAGTNPQANAQTVHNRNQNTEQNQIENANKANGCYYVLTFRICG